MNFRKLCGIPKSSKVKVSLDMLKFWLDFNEYQPIYAYQHHTYIKKSVTKPNLFIICARAFDI